MTKRFFSIGGIVLASGSLGLAACEGTVLSSNPSDAGIPNSAPDGSVSSDGSAPGDAGNSLDASNDGGTTCQAKAWPVMLAAPVVPLQSIASLNMNKSGPGTATLAYGESVNCPATLLDAGSDPGSVVAAWGPSSDVTFEYDMDAPNLLYLLQLKGGYTGTVAFHSRVGGAYGTHQYVIGMGRLQRDGAPFAIDWTGTSAVVVTPASIASVSELFDGIMATFAPTFPVESDCYAATDCIIVPDDLTFEANDGGIPSSAIFGFRPLKLYVQMPVGTSIPNQLYTFFTGAPDLTNPPPSDAGTVSGMDAGGGVTLPTGCKFSSADLRGSCAQPTRPLCGGQQGWKPFSCRDYPQSGYVATCCPTPDGG